MLRNVRADVPQRKIIARVEQSAVGIAAPLHQIVARLLGGGKEHHGSAEFLCQQRFGRLGTEIAEVDDQRIAVGSPQLGQRLPHIVLVFHAGWADVQRPAAGTVSRRDRLTTVRGKRFREAIAGNRDQTELDLRIILHTAPPHSPSSSTSMSSILQIIRSSSTWSP